MPTAYLTRIIEFDATHRLEGMAEHGHRYQCRVTVAGNVAPGRSGVMDLKALDAVLAREITTPLDKRSLNEAVPRWQPTGEALAVYVWERVAGQLPSGVRLHAVRIQEGPHLYSEYFGGGPVAP